jgi:putative FmdB family regulatory protein
MPIYAYRCETCGFTKDVLQKMSDAPLTECPSCSKSSFKKQLTAAGFQLKGTGWYVTDFRNGSGGTSAPAAATAAPAADKGSSTSDSGSASTTPVNSGSTSSAA